MSTGASNFIVLFLISYLYEASGIVPRYCMATFNRSDCGRAPKAVMTYYKPGSRCEVQIWRGCPTKNMFPDEYMCSHKCIGRLFPANREEENEIPAESECDDTLHNENCAKNEHIKVYTYDKSSKVCVKAVWKGCESRNVFTTEESCKTKCVGEDWDKQIDDLDPDEADEINDIIDDVIKTTTKAPDDETTAPDDDISTTDAEGESTTEAMENRDATVDPGTGEIDEIITT